MTAEQNNQEFETISTFYKNVIGDLKEELNFLVDKKATQVALNKQKEAVIQQKDQVIKELTDKLEEIEKKLLDEKTKNSIGDVEE